MLFTFAFGEDSERARAAVRDEDILAVARNGPDALRRLYEKTSKGVYAYALSLLKNAHDAEDVCQETFLSIYDKAGDYEPQGKPMAWIITVAKKTRADGSSERTRKKLHRRSGKSERRSVFENREHGAETSSASRNGSSERRRKTDRYAESRCRNEGARDRKDSRNAAEHGLVKISSGHRKDAPLHRKGGRR